MTGLVAHLPLAPWLSPEVYPGKNGAWASRGLHALRRLALPQQRNELANEREY